MIYKNLVDQHAHLTDELTAALRDLGQVRAKIITDEAAAWLYGADLNVTERREAVKHAIAHLRAEEVNCVAEVEAFRTQLADIREQIAYARDVTHGLS